MKGYWLILADAVGNLAAQVEYNRLWAPIAERYGARLLTGDAAPVLLETLGRERVILVEFASLALARACYDDPDYTEARGFAAQAAKRELVLFEGQL